MNKTICLRKTWGDSVRYRIHFLQIRSLFSGQKSLWLGCLPIGHVRGLGSRKQSPTHPAASCTTGSEQAISPELTCCKLSWPNLKEILTRYSLITPSPTFGHNSYLTARRISPRARAGGRRLPRFSIPAWYLRVSQAPLPVTEPIFCSCGVWQSNFGNIGASPMWLPVASTEPTSSGSSSIPSHPYYPVR